MTATDLGELIIRWMHITGAVMLVGSTLVMRHVYLPALDQLPSGEGAEFRARMRRLWARMVMLSSAQLLISGLIAVVLIFRRLDIDKTAFPGSLYHPILGIKILLSLAVFYIAALLSGRSAAAERLRQRELFWSTLNVALAVAVVLIGGLLRMADRSEKTATPATSSAAAPSVDELFAFARGGGGIE